MAAMKPKRGRKWAVLLLVAVLCAAATPVCLGQEQTNQGPEQGSVAANRENESQQDQESPDSSSGSSEKLHSISEDLLNVLLGAAISGDLLTVKQIIMDRGISPEVHNVLGWTPLNLAALAGRLAVVRFLILEVGANRETREIYGQTSLGSASINGHADVVRFLLNLDPPVNVSARDVDGATPLHYAAQFGYADVCYALLEKGADPNAVGNQNGWTPLHSAAAAGQIDAIRALLDYNADKELLDNWGNKPGQVIGLTLDITRRKRREIQCLLDPEAVFGGCEESKENNGQDNSQSYGDQPQEDWLSPLDPSTSGNPEESGPNGQFELVNESKSPPQDG